MRIPIVEAMLEQRADVELEEGLTQSIALGLRWARREECVEPNAVHPGRRKHVAGAKERVDRRNRECRMMFIDAGEPLLVDGFAFVVAFLQNGPARLAQDGLYVAARHEKT